MKLRKDWTCNSNSEGYFNSYTVLPPLRLVVTSERHLLLTRGVPNSLRQMWQEAELPEGDAHKRPVLCLPPTLVSLASQKETEAD